MQIFKSSLLLMIIAAFGFAAAAQDYISPTTPPKAGKAPGVKVKLLSTNGETKNYVLVFATGDELRTGLTEFAKKYNVKSAHYSAIGDASTLTVGWYDEQKKMFKVIPINEAAEITTLTGNIAIYNGQPVAHSHVNAATSDGIVHGGHLLELVVGPTLEVFITVEPVGLYKKFDDKSKAAVIDPEE
ncbi:PPC domain-containing DNA-binding protein [Pinibacter soli]|uniref:DNA-binding protein n=1 Tax=Pinibacter soli TaxID=3044211 RepID=A0ABT6RF59_9BACT|nr:PPC domain-containing DNA-binding protein [Pinibacter soli]MDI3321206.1 DNA-binding protein [Pinibacter soli]